MFAIPVSVLMCLVGAVGGVEGSSANGRCMSDLFLESRAPGNTFPVCAPEAGKSGR